MAAQRILLTLAFAVGAAAALLAVGILAPGVLASGAAPERWPWLVAGALAAALVVALGVTYRSAVAAERRARADASELRHEIAARERIEQSERGSAERFRAVIDNAHDAILAIDTRGRIETFNKAAERIFGYRPEEVLGRNVSMLMPEPYRSEHDSYLHNYITTGIAKIIGTGREVQARRKDGAVFPIDLSVGEMRIGEQRSFIGVIRDITERRQAERRVRQLTAELVHISRLSAMGQLSSSLAHELNQPLTAVMNYAEAARAMASSAPDRAVEYMEKAASQAERAGQIIRRLRGLVEKGPVERSPEDLSDIVEEACALATLGAKVDGVEVALDLARGLPPVHVDKVQIQQVVVNLVRNAVEALRLVDRRVLSIRTAMGEAGEQEVVIRDTGPGIPPEVAGQLFSPFVTTKKDGMGIGLSISRSIIEAHGGRLTCEPNPGGGTVFRFALPTAGATMEAAR